MAAIDRSMRLVTMRHTIDSHVLTRANGQAMSGHVESSFDCQQRTAARSQPRLFLCTVIRYDHSTGLLTSNRVQFAHRGVQHQSYYILSSLLHLLWERSYHHRTTHIYAPPTTAMATRSTILSLYPSPSVTAECTSHC